MDTSFGSPRVHILTDFMCNVILAVYHESPKFLHISFFQDAFNVFKCFFNVHAGRDAHMLKDTYHYVTHLVDYSRYPIVKVCGNGGYLFGKVLIGFS